MTPGPWELKGSEVIACHGEPSLPTLICILSERVDCAWQEDGMAIAALPGLLAAAKDIYKLLDKQFRKHPVPLDVFTRLYRAIALAEGRMSI